MQRERTAPDLIGKRVYRLVVVARAGASAEGHTWLCRCDCGGETILSTRRINSGKTKSCGCYRRELASQRPPSPLSTHGHSPRGGATPTYRSWRSMLARCRDSNHRAYGRYGGRGIAVCERWASTFENFLADMGERPEGKTLDRIDVDGNYEPGNCRWATRSQQRREGRSDLKLTMDGAREIRRRASEGEPHASIAATFGIAKCHVINIVANRKWREVAAA